MNDDLRRILGITVLCGLLILAFIASSLINMVNEYINPHTVLPQAEQAKATAINMPKPTKGYFVECMHDDVALVLHKNVQYYCTCERGKWVYKEVTNDQDYRDFKLPEPQRDHAGAL